MKTEPARKHLEVVFTKAPGASAGTELPASLSEHMTIELHQLIREGQGDSDEADALRERMYEAWLLLDPEERALVDSLSGDLYMLQGEESFDEGSVDPDSIKIRIKESWEAHDWARVLSLLRQSGIDKVIPEDVRAYFRARSWSSLGYLEAASCFFDHAVHLVPSNDNYVYLALDALVRVGRIEDALNRANDILRNSESSSRLLFKAADVLFQAARKFDERIATVVYKRVLLVLEAAFDKEKSLPTSQQLKSITVGGYVHKGFCHEHLGEIERAKEAYTNALAIDPRNDAALTARGLLLYETERGTALRDFERAVGEGTPLVWPYLYLAYDAVSSGELVRGIEMAHKAFKRTGDVRLRANLLEWCAIASARKDGRSAESVALLQEAQAFAPLNERIGANLERLMAGGEALRDLAVANDTTPREASERLKQAS